MLGSPNEHGRLRIGALQSIEESLERAKHETLAAKGHKDVDIASLFVEELGQDAAALHVLPANHYVLSCMFSVSHTLPHPQQPLIPSGQSALQLLCCDGFLGKGTNI